ncbi:MAG: polysaccharide biosynthesis protein [Lewinellaceae bacterium]|nr:polysaccharide biosynthesis protein [Lewinellaceae bacterium]
MGSIKRQGIGSGIFMYIGLIVGFVNNSLLFPRYVGEEILGFTQWLIELAGLFIMLASFASNATIIRFFPYFRDKSQDHNGFFGFIVLLRTIGLVFTALLLYLAKGLILDIYSKETSQYYIETYYPLLIVVLALTCYLEMLENYLAALMRPRIPTFFRDVFGRLTLLALILLYHFRIISLNEFIILYAWRFLLSILGMAAFTYYIGELHLKVGFHIFRGPYFKQIASYSFYSIFATIGSKITTKIDILMIPSLLNFALGGIYVVYSFFASVIILPHQGIAKIASPILADAWKREAYDEIKALYSRTALNNFAAGMLIFVGLAINLNNIVSILGPQFEVGKYVAVFLGVGQLSHIANGYNGLLINYSPQFRYDLYFKIITAVITVITNYIFISAYGIAGAAVATALTIILINAFIQAFIYRHYRMHPFSRNMLYVIGLGIACLLVNFLIPVIRQHFLIDLFVRSSIVTVLYAALLIGLRIAPDITDFFWEIAGRVRRK